MDRIAWILLILEITAQAQIWTWRGTAPLNEGRSNACIVRMADGRVMVSGGQAADPLSSVEIFKQTPAEAFTPAAPMNSPRAGHGCALVGDGRVLVAGGGPGSVELYEPSVDTWTIVESTVVRKAGTVALALPDGRTLIAGGGAAEVEVFDSATGQLELIGGPVAVRQRQSITMLRDGRVLFAGGIGEQGALNYGEIFDPASGDVSVTPAMASPRGGHSATLLLDGRVLLAGGVNDQGETDSLEVWLPDTNRFEVLAVKLKNARQSHVALLADGNGNVLFAGGSANGAPLNTSELFDPSTNAVGDAGSLTAARSAIAAIVLEDGALLATGGKSADGPSVACGVLPNPTFRFTQTVYHPSERAFVSGSIGVSGVNVRVNFDLSRIDATGGATPVNPRLLNASGSIVNGVLSSTAIVDVARDDIGNDFLLTMRATISATQTVTVQVRFSAKLRTTIDVKSLTAATVAGQPVPVRSTLTGDGLTTLFAGSVVTSAARSTIVTQISKSASFVLTDVSPCCPLAGAPSPGGIISLTASFGGSASLEGSVGSGSHLVVSNLPSLNLSIPTLRLATPATIGITAGISGPAIPANLPTTIDPGLRPTGSVSLLVEGGTVSPLGSAALQAPPPVFNATPSYPSSQATFNYTPTILDRRATSICFRPTYSGDSRYLPVTTNALLQFGAACTTVTAAPTALQILSPPSSYVLGSLTPFSVRLTWPSSVGIVSRTVNLLADGRPAGSITLTPNRLGLGVADGTASLQLPFNARNLTFVYGESGDLLGSQATATITMAPVSTTTSTALAATLTNPFSIPFSISINTRGLSLPPGTQMGGSMEFRDGDTVIGTLPGPTLLSGTGISDGTSNTILFQEVQVNGVLPNVVRPVGRRTFTVRFTGSPLFQPSQIQVVPTIQ